MDHEEDNKEGISRRDFLKGGVAGLAVATAGAMGVEAAQTSDIEKYGEVKDLGPMLKTVVSKGITYGYWTRKELDSGSVVGGGEIYASRDGNRWFNTNLILRSRDIAGKASLAVYDAMMGPKSGDVYFLVTNGVSTGYRDTQSGAGFLQQPGKLEVLRARGADLSVAGHFEGGSANDQRTGFVNIVNQVEGK